MPLKGDLGHAWEFKNTINHDGFAVTGIYIGWDSVGVVIKGRKADDLAERYSLGSHHNQTLPPFVVKAASRVVPLEYLSSDTKVFSINAFEGESGETLLFCQGNTRDELEQEKASIRNPSKAGR